MAHDELGTLRAELADARARAARLEAQRRDLVRALRESELRLAATLRQGQLEGIALSARTIAHRLNTVRDADRIVVLERGRIVQEGTFGTLAGASGPFAAMLARQV